MRVQQKIWQAGFCCSRRPGAPGCATGWSRWGATGTTWKSFDTRCATKRSHILLWPRSVYVTKTSVVGVDKLLQFCVDGLTGYFDSAPSSPGRHMKP